MTVLDALNWANNKLKLHIDKVQGQRLDSAMLDAEVILAACMDSDKSWLFRNLDYELKKYQEEKYLDLIDRRLNHEPVAYITGKKDFYKRTFEVNQNVLIPRPATETLIEEALQISSGFDPERSLFIDIGCGSGAICVTLAAETEIPVIATDISAEAIEIACINAKKYNVLDKIDFRKGSLLEPVVELFRKIQDDNHFDNIILTANLPYLTNYQWQTAQTEIREFEPKIALVGGTDGLDYYWKLFRQIKANRPLFPTHFTTLIEIDPSQVISIKKILLKDFPNSEPRIIKDLEGHDRLLLLSM